MLPIFSEYFINKLSKIINSLPNPTTYFVSNTLPYSFSAFTETTISQINKLLKITKISSSVDPLPLKILHQVTDTIAPPLLNIYTKSLAIGIVPDGFKTATITPILKKNNLDPLNITNYRPISNLSILSKTLERIVSNQLTDYLVENSILISYQSAYTPNKSTETSLTRITSDILSKLNNKNGIILALLDMSAAFDTLDHTILIQRLSSIGITDIDLKWFISYLNNRTSTVKNNNHSSLPHYITHGVPQGSVLGPILFNIYILPLLSVINKYHDISYHIYADDIQLYISCSDDADLATHRLSQCISDIHQWLNANSLRLNPSKYEAIFFHLPLRSGTTKIPYSSTVRDLGIQLDNTLSFKHSSTISTKQSTTTFTV